MNKYLELPARLSNQALWAESCINIQEEQNNTKHDTFKILVAVADESDDVTARQLVELQAGIISWSGQTQTWQSMITLYCWIIFETPLLLSFEGWSSSTRLPSKLSNWLKQSLTWAMKLLSGSGLVICSRWRSYVSVCTHTTLKTLLQIPTQNPSHDTENLHKLSSKKDHLHNNQKTGTESTRPPATSKKSSFSSEF